MGARVTKVTWGWWRWAFDAAWSRCSKKGCVTRLYLHLAHVPMPYILPGCGQLKTQSCRVHENKHDLDSDKVQVRSATELSLSIHLSPISKLK